MADGWRTANGGHQIWIANGVAGDGTNLPSSAYADATTGGFVRGPEIPVWLYRLEGDGLNGQFYMLQGSEGSFTPSKHTQRLEPCPACLPPLIFEDDFESGDTGKWSTSIP
jgi:hypothetical protein